MLRTKWPEHDVKQCGACTAEDDQASEVPARSQRTRLRETQQEQQCR
jgi:ubiquitin